MELPINQIFNMDCLEFMKTLPDKCIDLTVTSPPYDNLRTYNGNITQWNEQKWKDIILELFRITKQGGVVVWVVGDATIDGSETGTSFKQALYFKEIGFNLHDTMIYKSGKPPLTHNRYEQCFEYMFVFSIGKPKTFIPIKIPTIHAGSIKRFNYNSESSKDGCSVRFRDSESIVSDYKIKENIWEYATGMNGSTTDKIAFKHPAIFPEKLAQDHILSWSNKKDIVFDPFTGSGTTAKIAQELDRNYIGCELDKDYFEIAEKRLGFVKQRLF